MISCHSATDYKPSKKVISQISDSIQDKNICFSDKQNEIKWKSDSISFDTTFYSFYIPCERIGKSGKSLILNIELLACFKYDSLIDIWEKDLLDNSWSTILVHPLDYKTLDYWKEFPFITSNQFEFKNEFVEKNGAGKYFVRYENQISIKSENLHIYCEKLIWKPFSDEFSISGFLTLYQMKDGDTISRCGGQGATFSSDLSIYSIDQISGLVSYKEN